MLESFDHVILAFSEIPAIVGSSYKPPPTELELRPENGIVNVKNIDDDQCFKWSLTRYLNPLLQKWYAEKLTQKLRDQSEKLDWSCTSFPTRLHELDIFENMNKISVMVFGWDDDEKEVTYLRQPNTRHERNVRLFYYDGHYSAVKNMSALLRSKMGDNASHYCPYCTYHHRTADAVERHKKDCRAEKRTIEIMPKEGSVVQFENVKEIEFKPFVIYADFECRLEKVNI